MDHVNNAVYADWLDEAVIAAGGAVRRVRARSRAWPGSSTPAPPSPARDSSRPRPGRMTTAGRAGSPMPTARTCCGRASEPLDSRRMEPSR